MSFDKIFDLTAGVYFHAYNVRGSPLSTFYEKLATAVQLTKQHVPSCDARVVYLVHT